MMIPDRVIVRKIQEYDPYLYVEWNTKNQYFEVWRRCNTGRRLITPITLSIYYFGAPKEYVQMDERIIWWLYSADSWRQGGSKKYALEQDRRWKEFEANRAKTQKQMYKDFAKDAYSLATANFVTQYKSKNSKPKFDHHKPVNTWLRPDAQSLANPRAFARSRQNALKYGFKKCN
jgi:hypothetical protein